MVEKILLRFKCSRESLTAAPSWNGNEEISPQFLILNFAHFFSLLERRVERECEASYSSAASSEHELQVLDCSHMAFESNVSKSCSTNDSGDRWSTLMTMKNMKTIIFIGKFCLLLSLDSNIFPDTDISLMSESTSFSTRISRSLKVF